MNGFLAKQVYVIGHPVKGLCQFPFEVQAEQILFL